MTKSPLAIIEEIKAGLDGVTPGEWYSDTMESEGSYGSGPDCREGFTTFSVHSDEGVIADALNAEVTCVAEEYDPGPEDDWVDAVDVVAAANMKHIALCSKPNMLAITTAFETMVGAGDNVLSLLDEIMPALLDGTTADEAEQVTDLVEDLRKALNAAKEV